MCEIKMFWELRYNLKITIFLKFQIVLFYNGEYNGKLNVALFIMYSIWSISNFLIVDQIFLFYMFNNFFKIMSSHCNLYVVESLESVFFL